MGDFPLLSAEVLESLCLLSGISDFDEEDETEIPVRTSYN